MDDFFKKQITATHRQTIWDELRVKEDRHQNNMGNVALKKEVEEPSGNRTSREVHCFARIR